MRPGVVLDRDGTLVDFVRDEELGVIESAFHPDQLRFLPGALEGVKLLAGAGLPLAIATNQPGVAKGRYGREAVHRTNRALVERLADEGVVIARVEACLHHPEGGPGGDASLVVACACRKPKPGMILAIAAALGLDPARSFVLGDARADVLAARAAGFRVGLVADPRRPELWPMDGPLRDGELAAGRLDALAARVLEALG